MINLNRLKNRKQKEGKIEAQCPACAGAGADSKGNHLVVFPNGAFHCVAHPEDKEHNAQILKLTGKVGAGLIPPLTIKRQVIPETRVLMRIGQIGQGNPTPDLIPPLVIESIAGEADAPEEEDEYAYDGQPEVSF